MADVRAADLPEGERSGVNDAAELRAKMKVLSNVMLRVHHANPAAYVYGNAGQLISDVLTGELDPRTEEVRL